jgi:ABC-type phosphate transport system substrate-binding protein
MHAKRAALVSVLSAGLVTLVPFRGYAPPSYRVIVNSGNASDSLDRRFVAEAFLKKATRWPDGGAILPVDLATDSPARRRFSEEVLGRSVEAVKSYWQQLIFSGRGVPPPELDSEVDVVKYVARHPGGLGYVSGTADIAGVKAVAVR